MSAGEAFGGTFGDGVARPTVVHRPPDDGLPKLNDVLDADGNVVAPGAYRLAMDARGCGEAYIFVEASGAGRQWSPWVVAFGVRGLVVGRLRAPIGQAQRASGAGADAGAVDRVLVRFPVVEVLLAWRRSEMQRLNPESRKLRVNQRRRRPRNIMIR